MKRWLALGLLLVLALSASAKDAEEVLFYNTRDEIPLEFRWNLTDIFPTLEAFEGTFAQVEAMLPKVEAYKGRLAESPEVLAKALETAFDLQRMYGELVVYASQWRDTDTRNPDANELYLRTSGLGARVGQATAFIDPEISLISDETLAKFRKSVALQPYDHYLDNLVRLKPHIRNTEVEQVLASASLVLQAPFNAYSNLTSADIEWPLVKDENGEEKRVVPALYYSFVGSQDRRVRKEAALALFGTYAKYANTFAATYNGHVQRDLFLAHNRNYKTALEMVMNRNDVPVAVVDNLVATVHENLPLLYRYAALRKELLDIDEFHVYDLYVSLVPEGEKKYTYEEGKQLALDFWRQTYGEEYASVAQRAFDNRWVDVYASEGKRGGAYSWGTYNSHPYLLLNWGGTMEDVFTLVHEMGHSIHTYMTNENQPYQYSDYSLFVAEVASVASEALFLDYMLKRTDDPTQRLFLLNMYLNNITGTFLRQVFFHEFEAKAHVMAERGEALTKQSLGNMYAELWKEYYGPDLVLDKEFEAGWARIPHFYRTFYVWVYATSFAAGEAIGQRFRDGDPTAVTGYLNMLKLGDSVYPMEALKTAGVDMNNPEVIRTVMRRYEETLNEMEKLLTE